MTDHSNLFHETVGEVRNITTNNPLDEQDQIGPSSV
jgi:hypothetical protein